LVTGGSPRYQLYPTEDGRFAAVAALEQKFWESFCAAIGLAQQYRDDALDPAGTLARVGAIIGGKPGSHWQAVFAAADCCCTIVKSLAEATSDPQFKARGVFSARIQNARGAEMPALPTPVCGIFKRDEAAAARAPALGADNRLYAASLVQAPVGKSGPT
jgi:crotonobetainyl-CoA:carnitine CoA-transferase CaiB-like acyl-CoA transferase